MSEKHTAMFYVRLEPQYLHYWDPDRVTGVKATKLYQNKPGDTDGLIVKLQIAVPDEAWEPFAPPTIEMEYTQPDLSVEGEQV